jgi:hypothetical protein
MMTAARKSKPLYPLKETILFLVMLPFAIIVVFVVAPVMRTLMTFGLLDREPERPNRNSAAAEPDGRQSSGSATGSG